jgi:SpoVK/Ycf46/Vps4 family AAA+-type ATPase
LGGLKSKFVGESEGNLRKAFSVIETIGRCVVWLDEIEKALAGATDGSADGGVSSDALGAILSWMQDRPGEAFVIATSNDVTKLPPELLRKGRFDELWFVDLPTQTERAAILATALKANGRDPSGFALDIVATGCPDFTGSEMAALVPDALYAAFEDGEREPTSGDLTYAASNVVPLAKTAADKISRLREWAKGRARYATTPETTTNAKAGRTLDL